MNAFRVTALSVLMVLAGCGGKDAKCVTANCSQPPGETGSAPNLVAFSPWLAAALDGGDDVQVIDVRSESAFTSGHIPGARHVPTAALRTTVDGVPDQVVPAATVESTLSAAGVSSASTLVVVGAGTDTDAARMVWTLAHYGHDDVHLLDGGMAAWRELGGSVEPGDAAPVAGDYQAAVPDGRYAMTADKVLARLGSDFGLADARSAGEYDGGHIPGAISVDWTRSVTDGRLHDPATLEAIHADVLAAETRTAYCQTGSRAAVTWLILAWRSGEDVYLYDGSWAEWGADPNLPKEP